MKHKLLTSTYNKTSIIPPDLKNYLLITLLFFGVLTIKADKNYLGIKGKVFAVTSNENVMPENEMVSLFATSFNRKQGLASYSTTPSSIGIRPQLLWLKSNEGRTSWSDQSSNGTLIRLYGTVSPGFPLNYNPTNYFDSGYYYTDLDISASTHPYLSVISVYISSSDPAGALWGEGDGQATDGRGDRVMLDYKASFGRWNNAIGAGAEFIFDVDDLFVNDIPTISTVIFDEDVSDGSSAYVNGKKVATFTSNHSPGTSGTFEVGRVGFRSSNGLNTLFKGRVAEVLVYKEHLSRSRIESYLSLKYGISLDQTTPQSYVNSSGTEIYDADGMFNSFDHDIIGIGQDNISSLDQRISKSLNTGSILFLSKDANFTSGNNDLRRTALGNGNFLVTGHNGSPTKFNSDFGGILNTRMDRVWGLDQTGDVGNLYVAMRVASLKNLEKLYVVLSEDQTFDDSDTYSEMTKEDGFFWVGEIDPSQGNFMSFVSIAISPGNVSNNLVAWLKSEEGTNTNIDGNSVTSWNNSILNSLYSLQYFNRLNFTIGGVSYALNSVPPTYESDTDNLLNFHPSVLFQNDVSGLAERLFTRGVDNLSEILNAQPIQGSTFYAVGRPRGDFNNFWSSFDNDDPMIYDESPLGLVDDDVYFYVSKPDRSGGFEFESIPTTTTWENGEIALFKVTIPDVSTTRVTYNKNGGADDVINDVYVGGGYYHVLGNIGNQTTPNTGIPFDDHFGNIAETIIYNSASLTNTESTKIESYLALKYGITLDQTTAQSYINSSATEIYDADGALDSFDHNITGIGQDNGSSLDQRISKSINDNSVLILASNPDFTSVNLSENRTSLGDGNFLVVGNNGKSIEFSDSFRAEDHSLMKRVWAFDKTGTVEDVYIAVSVQEIGFSTSRLFAVFSSDQIFDESDIIIPMVNDGTNWSAEINAEDGNFMTFYRSNPTLGNSDHTVAWLKSEDGTNTITDGEDITSWENSVWNSVYNLEHREDIRFILHGIPTPLYSKPPTYESDANNLLNFHPSILFKGDGDNIGERLFVPGVDDATSALEAQPIQGSTFYAVGRPRGGANEFWAGFDSGNPGTSNDAVLSVLYGSVAFHEDRKNPSGEGRISRIFPTRTNWDHNEIALMKVTIPNQAIADIVYNKNGGADDILNDKVVSDGHYHILGNTGIGDSPNVHPFGNIAETIIYNSASLSNSESTKIESYLALKYGITLDQTTPRSYVNSSGEEIYNPYGKFDNFDHNIIGIGRDYGSSLDQRISRSVHQGSILILSHDHDFVSPNLSRGRTSMGDGNFLITGNDGKNILFNRSFLEMKKSRMSRIWAFHEKGAVGDVYVALPTSDLDLHGENLYVALSDGRFFDHLDRLIKMKNDGDYWYAKINPNNGDFMTFVSTDFDFSLDLYIKDFSSDVGEEPNTIEGKTWRSPDIWVRNNPDSGEVHQNPRTGNPNYVYIRVRNRSHIASQENDQVKLYWRKAGIVSRWPEGWTGGYENINRSTNQTNGLVGTATIPVIEPGEETIVQLIWNVPNPIIHSQNSSPWHFCFLARIVSEEDPMTNEQETYTSTNARNNNNIAWKNVTVVEAVTGSKKRKNIMGFDNDRSFGAVVLVGNPFDDARTFSIELIKEDIEGGKSIFDEAEVSLTMDETLYDVWKRSGKQSELLESTYNEKTKRVQDDHAGLGNLQFKPNEMGMLDLRFNFLPEELTDKSEFIYHVVQKDAETSEVVGGDTYLINKDSSPLIESSFKEYARVETKKGVNYPSKVYLDKIIPNPVTGTARITYNLSGAKSAYLMVVGFYHGATRTSNNYILDKNSTEAKIDLTNYPKGYYKVALVCDGEVVEVKTLIKQ